MSDAAERVAEDARELRRGVLTAYLGYVLKLGMPLLIALATRAYGAERWGRFVAAQAIVLLAARVCLFGLDKGLLWFVPQHGHERVFTALVPAACRACLVAALTTLGMWFTASSIPDFAASSTVLQITALGLLPLVGSELLLHATMGLRRMELQVAVRDTLNPLLQVLSALFLASLGLEDEGLAWAYVASQYVGLVVAWFGFRRLFRGAERAAALSFALPAGLSRYATPMWFAEMANSLLLRLDTLVLAALTSPATVGVWAIVSQFANALRQIRRTYDPMVTAITAKIAASHDPRRLSETFSYAVQMVSLTQLPVFAVFLEFSDAVLPLYGPGFERGSQSLVVLSACFLVSGGAGLAGLVVNGYGHSRLALINVLFSIVTQLVLLLVLAPRFGLLGAALATGLSLLATNALQLVQMRTVTGSFHFTTRARFSLAISLSSVSGLALADLAGRALALEPWTRRFLTMAAFACVYLALAAYGRREGFLRAPDSQVAAA